MSYRMNRYVISRRPPGTSDCRLIPMKDGTIGFESPYDPKLVEALKQAIPYSDRRWDRDQKLWFVAPKHAETLADLAEKHGMGRPVVPQVKVKTTTAIKLLNLMYLGASKDRGDGSKSSFGWVDGGWSAIFPVDVLKDWFAVDRDTPAEALTLYAILGIKAKATDKELKSAYRRTAKQWHPDVCSDPGAEEQFKRINEAYEILKNPLQRRKYDAGLTFAAKVPFNRADGPRWDWPNINVPQPTWRPPLRCGLILAQGVEQLGRFVVSEILQWEDITNQRGQTLVTSWKFGDDTFTERWV